MSISDWKPLFTTTMNHNVDVHNVDVHNVDVHNVDVHNVDNSEKYDDTMVDDTMVNDTITEPIFDYDLSTCDEHWKKNTCQVDLNVVCGILPPITPSLRIQLTKLFVATEDIPTPYIKDVNKSLKPCDNRYLDHKNPHPFDARIVFYEKPHIYFLDGNCENNISATTLLHCFFPEFDKNSTAHGTLESKTYATSCHRPTYKYYGCKTVNDIFRKWDIARDLGTELHLNIEQFLNNEPYQVCADNKPCFEMFTDIYKNKNFFHFENFRTEWRITDPELRISGSIDYAGLCENGDLVLLDWKRVENLSDCSFARMKRQPPEMGYDVCKELENCKMITYSLQMNLYKYIIERNYNMRVKKMLLIKLHPKQKQGPIVYKCPNMQKYIVKICARRLQSLRQ
jgi:hypothetical protein